MKIHRIEQRSEAWFALRLKYPLTASKAQAIGNGKAGLTTLCWNKMAEKYSSSNEERYVSPDIQRGIDLEPIAVFAYEMETSNTTEEVGFVTNDKISKVGGASPDRLVNNDGLLEIKCFNDVKHLKAIVSFRKTGTFEIESQYMWQMQMQLLFTGRDWNDYGIYNPNFNDSLLVQRVYPDKVMQDKIIEGLKLGEIIIKDIEKNL